MLVYRDAASAERAAVAMQKELSVPGLMASSLGDYHTLTEASITTHEFGRELADKGDDYGVALAMLRACSEGFGHTQDVTHDGAFPSHEPMIVHGDLHVRGSFATGSALLVTGSLSVDGTFYNGGYTTVLGSIRARGLTTGPHCYVGESIQTEVLWAGDFSDSWLLAKSIETKVFIEAPSHALANSSITSVRASVNEDNGCPLEMLLADVFEPDLYDASGMPSRSELFARVDSGGPLFATTATPTPLPFSVFEKWLGGRYRSTQREKLEQIKHRWMPRLACFERESVRKLLKRHFTSPKRNDELNEVLEALP